MASGALTMVVEWRDSNAAVFLMVRWSHDGGRAAGGSGMRGVEFVGYN